MAIILFINLKGGVAKTTNAVAVAETLAEQGKKVLMIDADHQCTAGELLLGEKRLLACEGHKATLHDLLAAMLDDEFNSNQIGSYIENGASDIRDGIETLDVLPCSFRIDEFSTNMAKAKRGYHSNEEFLRVLKRRRLLLRKWFGQNYDYTIVDCPPSIALQVKILMIAADAYIIPTIPDRLSLRGCAHLTRRIKKTGVKIQPLGTLWSLYRQQNVLHQKIVKLANNRNSKLQYLPKPFKNVIPNAAAIAQALEESKKPVSLSAKYSSKFAKIYKNLCAEIDDRVKMIEKVNLANKTGK